MKDNDSYTHHIAVSFAGIIEHTPQKSGTLKN